MLIGITGGSGCGKSMVSEEFTKSGMVVIDADTVAREVTEPEMPALSEIEKAFGSEYISEDGVLLRKKLGSLVFSDTEKLALLNSIINKYLRELIDEKIKNADSKIVCLDAPLLIEYDLDERCDVVVAVLADAQIRAERICKRDGISLQDAENRIKSQKNDDFYLEKADYIVYNNSDKENAKKEIQAVIDDIVKKYGE